MPPRIYVGLPLGEGDQLVLPPGPSRHVQVLRLQPGAELTCFNGLGGEWSAIVERMGRSDVDVRIGAHTAVDRELPHRVTLAVGMPANERMDNLIEKATELGAAVVQPLLCERSVLRLSGERAQKKVDHWRGVAIAASEQSGRTRVPTIEPVMTLPQWLAQARGTARCFVLSLRDASPFDRMTASASMVFLSGPEGGLSPAEESLAVDAGFVAVSLGTRVLRADTAPMAVLSALSLAPSQG